MHSPLRHAATLRHAVPAAAQAGDELPLPSRGGQLSGARRPQRAQRVGNDATEVCLPAQAGWGRVLFQACLL